MRSPLETVGSGARAEKKVVLHFRREMVKPLIIGSITNWDAMVAVTGRENSEDWAGSTIELYTVDVLGPQGPTRGIRIRKPTVTKKTAPRPASPPPCGYREVDTA